MKILSGIDKEKAEEYIYKTVIMARKATCLRSKCGSVVVKNNQIIGSGFNSPPANLENQRRCICLKGDYHKKVTDKTCCLHAEQRAIIDSLKNNPDKLDGSRIYFIRLDEEGLKKESGEPYCTICSKMALDVGIKEFVLLKKEGICVYDTEEYNDLSYKFKG